MIAFAVIIALLAIAGNVAFYLEHRSPGKEIPTGIYNFLYFGPAILAVRRHRNRNQ
jgi:hypothetical protein